MKIIDLYNEIYVFRFRRKRKVFHTRNKTKRLRKIISNGHMFEALMKNNAVKVVGQIPENIKKILINEYRFHIRYSTTRNLSSILALVA